MSLAVIEKVTAGWRELADHIAQTGVCYLERDYTYNDGAAAMKILSSPSTRRLMRGVAKELKRPFVVAEVVKCFAYKRNNVTNKYERTAKGCAISHHRLTVPRQKRTQKMVSMLLLLSSPYSCFGDNNAAVVRFPLATVWRFTFQGERGKELFENFMAQARAGAFL